MTKQLNIGMVGYGFMARAHSNAWANVAHFFDTGYRPVLKAVAARTYGRLRAVERGERKAGLSLRPVRHGLAIAGLLLMLAASAYLTGPLGALFMLLPLLWLGLLYRHAIITTPRYLQQLAEEYDSLTRLIYSGDEPSAIASALGRPTRLIPVSTCSAQG
mgnify:CR=1 FL=1